MAGAYLVPDWVRVRAEDFGLLFYDTRSTHLTFVRSGDRLVPPPFVGERRFLQVRESVRADLRGGDATGPSETAIARLLADLVEKGLLVAVPGG